MELQHAALAFYLDHRRCSARLLGVGAVRRALRRVLGLTNIEIMLRSQRMFGAILGGYTTRWLNSVSNGCVVIAPAINLSAPQPRSRSGTCVKQDCKTQKQETEGAMCPTAQIGSRGQASANARLRMGSLPVRQRHEPIWVGVRGDVELLEQRLGKERCVGRVLALRCKAKRVFRGI